NSELEAAIRDVITAWASGLPEHPYTDFGQKVSLSLVEEKPTFAVYLRTLYDIRNPPSEFKRPYNGEPPLSAESKERATDIWNYQVELKKDFTEEQADMDIPSSLSVGPCLRCMGQGKGPCDRCSGSKVASCEECNGRGQKSCIACQGRGKMLCA